ncbi:MAG TPA: hypothetical protein VFD02_02080 [Syntrophomonadaceae bacterium]|nr:hypothetical protein [Syntrophomonadaceae bacterium]
MKKISRKIVIILMMISLVGCSLPTAPSNLIKPPAEDEANMELKRIVDDFLPPEARLTIPKGKGEDNRAILLDDVTGDGREEIIAFFKTSDFGLGFIILAADDKGWQELSLVEEYGEEIDLVELTDITGDKKPELLVGFTSGSSLDNRLFMYSFSADGLKELATLPYSTFTLGDINGDKLVEIVVSKNERINDIPTTLVEIYKYGNGCLDLFHTSKFEGYPGELLVGQANRDTVGLFVEVYLGAHSAASYLLAYLEGELIPVLTEEYEDISYDFKPYPLPAQDANGDGIIEIGVHHAPPGSDGLAMVEIPWLENWYQWDGKNGLKWVSEVYADYGYGYKWEVPESWRGNYTLTRENSEESSLVEFYDLTKHQHKLFTFWCMETDLWENEKDRLELEDRTYAVLAENQLLDKVYVAILPEPKTCRCFLPMSVNLDEIKQGFALLTNYF